jgi:hypothetical protein
MVIQYRMLTDNNRVNTKVAAAFAGEVDRLIHFKNIYHFSAKYKRHSIGQP